MSIGAETYAKAVTCVSQAFQPSNLNDPYRTHLGSIHLPAF